jgi:CRP-like cAMP-binding protein
MATGKSSSRHLSIYKDKSVEKLAIFKDLTSKQIDELFMWVQRRDYTNGQTIIKEDRVPSGLFILIGGRVSVVKSSRFGKVKLTEIDAPSILGEVGLLSGRARTARVRALTPVCAGFIPAALFKAKLASRNVTALCLCLNIARILCKRLDDTSDLACAAGLYFAEHSGELRAISQRVQPRSTSSSD